MSPPTRRPTPRPRRTGWRRFLAWKPILFTLLGLVLTGVAAFMVAWIVIDVPGPNQLADAQASIIYYADGKTEMDRVSDVNRESVPLSRIPVQVQRAVLAAEDRGFYENRGVSPSGVARAVVAAVRGGPTQGGSTITQQYVKNYFLTQDQTLARKGKELIISLKIDQQESKSEILENYLNTIYYGRGAYGIQTASKAYFDKDVSQLGVSQGALLASVIRGPSFYDPSIGAEQTRNAQQRVRYVLDGMASKGWLSPAERAKATFPQVIAPRPNRVRAGPAGYITAEVRKELAGKLKLGDDVIDRGGLRITTTIDRKAQSAAVAAVNTYLPTGKNTKDLKVGLTAIKPGDGAIVAMYGGRDYSKVQLNSATDATMQAGSTFKAFTLLAALKQEISTKTSFDGSSPQHFPDFGSGTSGRVPNFGGESFGRIDLRTATANSVNTVYAQLNLKLRGQGKDTMDAAIAAGVPKNTPGLQPNLSNVFGTASPHVVDMANAYATIAAEGVRATPYLLSRVTDVAGVVDYTVKKQVTPAFDKGVAIDATDAMEQVVLRGSGSFAQGLGRPAAGKTGTTDGNKAAWFDGFTPQLAASVGMYNDVNGTPTSMVNIGGYAEITGGTYPVRIWTEFMRGALAGSKVVGFPNRVGIGDGNVYTPPPVTTTTPSATTSSRPTTSSPTTSKPTTSKPTTGPTRPTRPPRGTRTRTIKPPQPPQLPQPAAPQPAAPQPAAPQPTGG